MANVKFNLEADEAKAVQAFLRVVDAQRKAEGAFKKTTGAAKKQDDIIGTVGRGLGNYVTGFASAAGAITLATNALKFHNAELEKASGRTRAAEFSLSSLSQLAGGDKSEMRRMVDEAKKTSVGAGIDLSAAARLQFNLESFGIADQRELFQDLVGTVEDPGALAEAAVTLREAFGKKETGSIRAILNKGLAASSVSKTTLNSLLTNAAQIAPGIAEIGGSDEEALSALSILSKARRSPEQAATEIQALSKVILRQGLGGKGLVGGIDAIMPKISGLSDQDRLKFFGDVEGFKAFSTLTRQSDDVNRALRVTDAGNVIGPTDQVSGAIAVRKAIPEIASAEALRQSEQATGQRRSDIFGVDENRRLSTLQKIEEASLKRGESPFTRFLRVSAAEATKFFGGDEEDITRVAAGAGAFGSTGDAVGFLEAVRELNANIKGLNGNVQNGRLARNGGMTE